MSYQDIQAADVGALLQRDNLIIIDTRDAQSQSLGQLPQARSASDAVINDLVRQRRANPPVLVYCYEGHQSREMCSFLHQLGLSEVYNLAGGWAAWSALPEPVA